MKCTLLHRVRYKSVSTFRKLYMTLLEKMSIEMKSTISPIGQDRINEISVCYYTVDGIEADLH